MIFFKNKSVFFIDLGSKILSLATTKFLTSVLKNPNQTVMHLVTGCTAELVVPLGRGSDAKTARKMPKKQTDGQTDIVAHTVSARD